VSFTYTHQKIHMGCMGLSPGTDMGLKLGESLSFAMSKIETMEITIQNYYMCWKSNAKKGQNL
jgi:hypothetical protein